MCMKIYAIAFLLSLSVSDAAAAELETAGPVNVLDFTGVELGQTHPFAKVRAHVEGMNVAGRTLDIERVQSSQPGRAEVDFEPVVSPTF